MEFVPGGREQDSLKRQGTIGAVAAEGAQSFFSRAASSCTQALPFSPTSYQPYCYQAVPLLGTGSLIASKSNRFGSIARGCEGGAEEKWALCKW